MKLQSQVGKEYQGKKYFKNWIVVKNKYIEQLGWEKGDELDCEIVDGKLVISKKED